KTYGVDLLDAHDAAADALAALDISRALAERSTEIAALSKAEIMAAQADWKREQAAGLQAWLRTKSTAEAVVDRSCPMARTLDSTPTNTRRRTTMGIFSRLLNRPGSHAEKATGWFERAADDLATAGREYAELSDAELTEAAGEVFASGTQQETLTRYCAL